MPRGFNEQEKKWIVERLLQEGHKQFAAYGLKKTSVEELAVAAGISKGAFYLFYESKEALFMDVMEQAEQSFREVVMAAIDLPGPSPRARLVAVFEKAFTLWKTIPILQIFTSGDYEFLARRIAPELIQQHLRSDRVFIEELVARCRQAGIPIKAPIDDISNLMYILLFSSLHEDDFGPNGLSGAVHTMIELVAAFCLGEVNISERTTQ